QPSMADWPPQRIHALLSATPRPERPSPSSYRGFYRQETKHHRDRIAELSDPVSHALTVGGRGKQNMDVLRASRGRMPRPSEERPPNRQGVASFRKPDQVSAGSSICMTRIAPGPPLPNPTSS